MIRKWQAVVKWYQQTTKTKSGSFYLIMKLFSLLGAPLRQPNEILVRNKRCVLTDHKHEVGPGYQMKLFSPRRGASIAAKPILPINLKTVKDSQKK